METYTIMNDIKKSSRNLKYNSKEVKNIPILRHFETRSVSSISSRDHKNILNKKVEAFEESIYEDEDVEDKSVESFYNRNSNRNIRNKVLNKKSIKRFSSKFKILSAIFTSLIVIFLLTSFVFNNATIEIIPKIFSIKANTNIDFENSSSTEDYQIVEIKKEATKQIEKGEIKKNNTKSFGSITIYNNFNENTQKLVKNTRFESGEGKIFRISDSITVPGKTSTGPGSVTVKVTADSFGPSYNISPSKFKIPGFKGSARYEGFYAESKNSMSGGSSGESSAYSAVDIESTDMMLRSEIRELIKKDIPSIYKKNYSIVYDTSLIEYSNNKDKLLEGVDDKYIISANAKVILIKDDSIAKNLSKKYITGYAEENVIVSDISQLKISIGSSTEDIKNKININFFGDAEVIMKIDESKLKENLASKKNTKEEFVNILSKFTEIKQATPKIFPPWINTFPKNINKINIVTTVTKKE